FYRTQWASRRPALRLPPLQKLRDAVVGARERGLVGQEHNAKMPRARHLSEAAAVHHEDLFGDQQPSDELLIGPVDIQSRERVESASGSDASQSRRAVQILYGEVAARAQLADHLRHVVLRPLQRRAHGVLLRM